MNALDQQKLLFLLIENQKLIYHATQWQLRDLKGGEPCGLPKRLSTHDRNYNGPDLHSVDAHISLINELDDESVSLKYADAAKKFTEQGPLNKRSIPITISEANLKDRVRQQTMNRLEATLLSLGFLLPKNGQLGFDLFVFENRMNNRLSIDLQTFPLAIAVIEREGALSRSNLFKNSHWRFRNDEANTLEIFEWFERMEFTLPKGLVEMARKYHGPQKDVNTRAPDTNQNELNPKERSSMLTLIHAMATSKFQYQDGKSLGPAKNKIYLAVQDAGLSMSKRTIGDYLTAAQEEADRLKDKNQ